MRKILIVTYRPYNELTPSAKHELKVYDAESDVPSI